MVRYSAYTRPYALPLFLLMLFAYAAQQWLQHRDHRWLRVATVTAVSLPLARVPEPTVFLTTTAATLAWFTHRGRFSWSQIMIMAQGGSGKLARAWVVGVLGGVLVWVLSAQEPLMRTCWAFLAAGAVAFAALTVEEVRGSPRHSSRDARNRGATPLRENPPFASPRVGLGASQSA